MAKHAEDLFLKIALESGVLTSEQAEVCRADQARLAEMGFSRTLAQICREKGLLSPDQISRIRREMTLHGVFPRIGGYELIASLGQGGMGTVYSARQISLDRIVALKVLRTELARNREFVKRFEREGRLAGRLSHPNAVQVYDVGHDAERHYMAMEFVEGSDVEREMTHGPMEEAHALEIIRGVAQALSVAHEHGIVHRDIKPANILLDKGGSPKLSDLGIAKQVGVSGETLTQTGTALGTPAYMSPEQCLGRKDIDGRSDFYSLGATLFHMVCGKPPFHATTMAAIIHKHVYEPLPDPQAVNLRLTQATAQLIRRMMEKEPGKRFQTCAELLAAIKAAQGGEVPLGPESQVAPDVSAPRAGTRPAQSSKAQPVAAEPALRPAAEPRLAPGPSWTSALPLAAITVGAGAAVVVLAWTIRAMLPQGPPVDIRARPQSTLAGPEAGVPASTEPEPDAGARVRVPAKPTPLEVGTFDEDPLIGSLSSPGGWGVNHSCLDRNECTVRLDRPGAAGTKGCLRWTFKFGPQPGHHWAAVGTSLENLGLREGLMPYSHVSVWLKAVDQFPVTIGYWAMVGRTPRHLDYEIKRVVPGKWMCVTIALADFRIRQGEPPASQDDCLANARSFDCLCGGWGHAGFSNTVWIDEVAFLPESAAQPGQHDNRAVPR